MAVQHIIGPYGARSSDPSNFRPSQVGVYHFTSIAVDTCYAGLLPAGAGSSIGSSSSYFAGLFVAPNGLDTCVFDVTAETNNEVDVWNTAAAVGNSVAFVHFATSDTGFGPLNGATVGLHIPNGLALYMRSAYRVYFGTSDTARAQFHETTGDFAPWDTRPGAGAPAHDNEYSVGETGNRWKDAYFGGNIRSSKFSLAATAWGSTADVYLERDGADQLALRRGTNAQEFNHYYSYVDSTHFTRCDFYWATFGGQPDFVIAPEQVGQGTSPHLTLGVNGSRSWRIYGTGTPDFVPTVDNSYSIGRAGSTVKDVFFTGKLNPTSPNTYTVSNPTVTRSLDETTVLLSDVAKVLGTLINDLKTLGLLV